INSKNMSNRYNFRARAGGASAAQPNEPATGTPPAPDDETHNASLGSPLTRSPDGPSVIGGVYPGSERRPGVSYSQAVGSRTSSPLQGAGWETASAAALGSVTNNRKHRVTVEDVTDEDDRDGPWTTVVRRRARSTGSMPVNSEQATPPHRGPTLSAAQMAAVRNAKASMTDTERERVGRRMTRVQKTTRHSTSSSSRGEGPSRDKGKTVDARNWGAAGIPDEELSPDAQRRALDLYSVRTGSQNKDILDGYDTDDQREMLLYWKSLKASQLDRPDAGQSKDKEHAETAQTLSNVQERTVTLVRDGLHDEIAALRREIEDVRAQSQRKSSPAATPGETRREKNAHNRKAAKATKRAGHRDSARDPETSKQKKNSIYPVAQIEPGSYLGRAFADLTGLDSSDDDDDSSSNSSSSSGGSPSSSGSDGDGNVFASDSSSSSSPSSGEEPSKKKRKHKKRRTKKPVLKPEKPAMYDGRADTQVFHKFMRQMIEYLKGHTISNTMYASTVSNFLTGTAYSFWESTVAKEPHKWKLRKLFQGLFNHCFPADHRLRERERLRRCRQDERSVREYVHELETLLLTVGIDSERERVDKLWNGLSFSIQKELWKKQLTPIDATWAEVRSWAERIEIAERLGQRAGPRTGGRGYGERRNEGSGAARVKDRHPDTRFSNSRAPLTSSYRPPNPIASGANRYPLRSDATRAPNLGAPRRPAPGGQRSKLSDKERADLTAAGKCFLCKEVGHFANRCPKAQVVRSDRKGKPPGLTSYNVELGTARADAEELRALADSTESTAGISLHAVGWDWIDSVSHTSDVSCDNGSQFEDDETSHGFTSGTDAEFGSDPDSDASDSSDIDELSPSDSAAPRLLLPLSSHKGRPETQIGDLYAERAEELLAYHGPYCCQDVDIDRGDECSPNVYRTTDKLHVIFHWNMDDILIESADLKNPSFDIVKLFRRSVVAQKSPDHQACFLHDDDADTMGCALQRGVLRHLEREYPWPESDIEHFCSRRFCAFRREHAVRVKDMYLGIVVDIPIYLLENVSFDLLNFYARAAQRVYAPKPFTNDDLKGELRQLFRHEHWLRRQDNAHLSLLAVRPVSSGNHDPSPYLAVQRNAATPRDFSRLIPEPAVVVVLINGEPARALLDSGSLSDFMSAKLAHQLGIQAFELAKPLPVHLAVQGSRAKINYGCRAQLEYQRIKSERYFDIINLLSYDLILGTPFLFQHQVSLGFNPTAVVIGSPDARPIEGKQVRVLQSQAAELLDDRLEEARRELSEYAAPICKEASDSPLPPLRAINHRIPLIDPEKIYSWRPSKCPDAHRASWMEKRDAYLKSGRWKMSSARNTSPMLLLTKPGTGVKGIPPRLRVVCDLREQNANTLKVTSPLPDMEGILRRLARHPYRSLIDGKDTYEQIRVEPDHVSRTAMTTPDGNMVSLVLQQGDCNAVATYQGLMNHIFGPHIGVFMDVYLDDIAVYSDTLADHVRHVKQVVDILKQEQLYLSSTKLHFLCRELKVLGRIVDDQGIRMDPDKVDSVLNWKTPTNKELLRGFLGSVGYLADDIATIRIPMGILASMTGATASFKWEFTHQRAFDQIKRLVHVHREHRRQPLDYAPDAPPIWLVTDGSHGGVAGVVSQGLDFHNARVAAFFSAKLSSAQSNYPVHEIEMLAGVEAMQRHRDILLGCHFTWVTDHKGLVHLLEQRNLSGRQARWLEKISEFSFAVEYIPGAENVLADALSRIYSNDQPGTVRSPSEYVVFDTEGGPPVALSSSTISVPLLVEAEGRSHPALALADAGTSSAAPVAASASARPRRGHATVVAPHAALTSRMSAATLSPKRPRAATSLFANSTEVPLVKDPSLVARRKRAAPAPAETGRPETAAEFAKRVHRLVLHGPRVQREEGGSPDRSHSDATADRPADRIVGREPPRRLSDVQSASPIVAPEQIEASGADVPVAQDVAAENESSLLDHIASASEGTHLEAELKDRYGEDPFFQAILASPKQFKNFEVENGLIFLKDRSRDLLCVPDIRITGRNVREIVISHAHSLLAHLGPRKTSDLLRDHVWWKTLIADVQKFCDTCMTCKRSKPNNQKPYGLLNPLPVPSIPWEAIGIDFVGPLPVSKDRDASYDSITTIIDLLTGMVHLVPSRTTYRARDVAELVFAEVYKHHGLPKSIVSDRDVLFTSTFWAHLNKLIGVELRMSSAYHPESDGSTERANRTIGQMLRQCVGSNQKDWVAKLPAIEFAINMARSDSTGYAPFFLNTGRMPRPMIWDRSQKDEYPGVRAYAQKVKSGLRCHGGA
ncbi:Retrovirus-related Pol polyprotein from transposon 17.6, partial [Trametes pubescens]